MSLIEWREDYCTGIEGVDFEHQELIRQINEVYEMIERDSDREQVIDSLGEIYGSIAAHFALEEQMMRRHDYDRYAEHKADHDRLLDDIRDAVRIVIRQPRHSFLIVLLITISVAGNAAVFPLFNGFLLRPLPFDDPERLVAVDETAPQWNLEFLHIAWQDFVDWRRDNRSFDSIAVYRAGGINFGGDIAVDWAVADTK